MALVFVGTDFHDTPLSDLEKLERQAEHIRERLCVKGSPLDGVVLLATCNRFEVYFEAESFHESLDFVIRQVAQELALSSDAASSLLKVHHGSSLAQHLFSVASGLESLIIGEAEISGQVRRALADAQNRGLATSNLQRLFQSALGVSKEVTSQTGIGASGRSAVSAALELAQNRLGPLAGKQALIIGTGAYARVVTAALRRAQFGKIGVYSRSGRQTQFALSHDLYPVGPDDFVRELGMADLVVSASGSSGYAIDHEMASRVHRDRAGANLVIIDVALSRDVAPEVSQTPGFEVIDLELLREQAPQEHIDAVISAQEIVRRGVQEFDAELKSRLADPVISALRAHIGLWVEQEVASVRRKSGDDAAQEVSRSLQRVTNAILHTPSVKVKDLAKDGNHEAYLNAVKLLFDLELGIDVEN